MKKFFFCSTILVTALFSASAVQAETGAIGGWSEEEGYWEKADAGTDFSINSTASHRGWHTYSNRGTATYKRVHGETVWTGRHYTRARFEMRFTGKIYHDSGRKFNVGNISKASSTGEVLDDALAPTGKTYYGR
ncbi:hypothetical protein CHH78_10465 [Shouchella clausii]|uniref:hypothetical protein n=1 Tax=Shouchella TaxID=2893057 RepID=UPI000BA6E15B|nr:MULTISPECIES: hypothetical protein [Shouchella]PAD43865.1 hypothetical protein CHH54_04650 [Bacillus sp. 7520-S]MBU8597002.1 hypothetical protein [Shouchella clausii]MCY1104486.1 hypothetical protein [Shouchella clausii]MED4157216.1 hypothetical protein [Shouchella clausii]MED4175150.1 hypothetical protein [Shouchella clausii]